MRLTEVQRAMNAEVLCGAEWLERRVSDACGSDLMSDVLAFTKEQTLLLTGLTNIQVIRTAEISDIVAVLFVRGKRPGPEVIELAQTKGIPLLMTKLRMYDACGLLYKGGLSAVKEEVWCR